MKLHLLLAILLCACCSGGRAATNDPAPTVNCDEVAKLLDPVFAKGMQKENIPGAVFVLVKDGQVIFAKGYGVMDVNSGRSVDPERTIFPIASITKMFTATGIMQSVDSGRLDLDADVNRYLTSVRVPDTYPQPITTAHLLTHTSGLDELPGRRVKSAADVRPLHEFLANRLVRVHPPAEVTSYSSYGIALAGLLLAELSGESFENYLSAHIWQPLGMNRTFITVPAAQTENLATAYEIEGGKPVAIPYEIYQTPPTSSVISTANDMGKFMIAHLQKGRFKKARILSENAVETMQQQHATMHPRMPGWGTAGNSATPMVAESLRTAVISADSARKWFCCRTSVWGFTWHITSKAPICALRSSARFLTITFRTAAQLAFRSRRRKVPSSCGASLEDIGRTTSVTPVLTADRMFRTSR